MARRDSDRAKNTSKIGQKKYHSLPCLVPLFVLVSTGPLLVCLPRRRHLGTQVHANDDDDDDANAVDADDMQEKTLKGLLVRTAEGGARLFMSLLGGPHLALLLLLFTSSVR